jgi:hypothetical protein
MIFVFLALGRFESSAPLAEEAHDPVEFPKIGHAPALMDSTQIAIIAEFLRP